MKTLVIPMLFLFALAGVMPVYANEVEILDVHFIKRGKDSWTVRTQVKHEDTGWKHYADAWRIVDEQGNELGQRVLAHPHVNEQPFTRSLSGLKIPRGTNIVFVEARDSVHGWAEKRVRVDLRRKDGPNYRVSQ